MREELIRCWVGRTHMDREFGAWGKARGGNSIVVTIQTCSLTSLQEIYAIYLLYKLKGN